jgi:hypothetical protein
MIKIYDTIYFFIPAIRPPFHAICPTLPKQASGAVFAVLIFLFFFEDAEGIAGASENRILMGDPLVPFR